MPRKSNLTAEQIAKITEMLKAKVAVSNIAKETGAKPHQINVVKRKLGLVKPRKARRAARAAAAPKVSPAAALRPKAGAVMTIDAIRARLNSAQKEVERWQEALLARVSEIERMIATIKKI